MITILLGHHSYWWQKHSCFPQVRLYMFFFKHKDTSLRVYRFGKLIIFSNIQAKVLWFPCLKKRWFAINLKRHTVEALTYPIQYQGKTYTNGTKKEPPPCLKCTLLIRPKSQQSPLSVVTFWGFITHNNHKHNKTCNILSCTWNPLAEIPT